MAKEKSEFVKNVKLTAPQSMDYYVPLSNDKERRQVGGRERYRRDWDNEWNVV